MIEARITIHLSLYPEEGSPTLKMKTPITLVMADTHRYGAAERDCSVSLALDGSYVKAYLRRGTARMKLGRMTDARKGQ